MISLYAGLTSQTIDLFIQDSTTGAGETGLVYNTSGLAICYRKGATATMTAITLATQTVGGAWSSGGFVEIDSTNAPGLYRLDIPNAAIDTAGFTTVYVKGTGIVSAPVRVDCRALPGDVKSNNDKTGYSLSQSFPTNFASLAITGGGAVTAGTVSDKTGYSLSQSFPTNFSSLAITGAGAVTAGTVSDKTGYSLSQSFPTNFASLAITGGGAVTAGTVSDKTGYSLATAPLDAAGVRAAVGLASNNLDTQLGTLATSSALSALVATVGVAGVGLTEAGGTGDQFTAIPWNAAWDAEVQSECTDAIVAAGLPRSGVTLRYTQVAANSGSKTADVSIGEAS